MLARDDLDFEPQRSHRRDLRLKPVHQRDAAFGTRSFRSPRPRVRSLAHCVQQWPDGASRRLHEVDVFRVAARRLDEQFIERYTAAQRNLAGERWCAEKFDQCPREDEVLRGLRDADRRPELKDRQPGP